jgi:hypothetical protein
MGTSVPPNQAFELLAELKLMVLYQLLKPPTDAEWDTYLGVITECVRAEHFRYIVVTEGAYPTRAQQGRLTAVVKGKLTRVAVISPAISVRFVVAVMSLVNAHIKVYSPKEQPEAFAHVGLDPAEYARVAASIERIGLALKRANRVAA